jgi:hypothetical protein
MSKPEAVASVVLMVTLWIIVQFIYIPKARNNYWFNALWEVTISMLVVLGIAHALVSIVR